MYRPKYKILCPQVAIVSFSQTIIKGPTDDHSCYKSSLAFATPDVKSLFTKFLGDLQTDNTVSSFKDALRHSYSYFGEDLDRSKK